MQARILCLRAFGDGEAAAAKWLLVTLLVVEAHFGASYLVPLKVEDQGLFAGLLRWVWPWGVGDRGFLGAVTEAGFPFAGFLFAIAAAGAFAVAALAALGWLVPQSWWKAATVVGVAASLVLVAGFLNVTKVLPISIGLALLWVVFVRNVTFG